MGEADPSQTTKGENLNGCHSSDKVSGISPQGEMAGRGRQENDFVMCSEGKVVETGQQ